MSISRYFIKDNTEISISPYIRKAVKSNTIRFKTKVSEEGKRLDHYAFEEYGDGRLWWIISAASGIGWWVQVPPGIVLSIPTNLDQIERLKEIV